MRRLDEESCVVVNKENIVLGLLPKKLMDSNPTVTVEEVMEPGPKTFRPHLTIEEAIEYMRHNKLTRVLVTTPDGRLVGTVKRPE